MRKSSDETKVRLKRDETKRLTGGTRLKKCKKEVYSLKDRPENQTLPYKKPNYGNPTRIDPGKQEA